MPENPPSKQLPHLVFGGEVKQLDSIEFKDQCAGHRRHLSQLRQRLCGVEGAGAADRG